MTEVKKTTRPKATTGEPSFPKPAAKDPVAVLAQAIIINAMINKGVTGEAAIEASKFYVNKIA